MNLETIIQNYLASRTNYLKQRALLLKHAPSLPDLLDGIKQAEKPAPVSAETSKSQALVKQDHRLLTLHDGTPLADFVTRYATQQGGTVTIKEVKSKLVGLTPRIPSTITMTVIMRRAGLVKVGRGAATCWRLLGVASEPKPEATPDLIERLKTQLARKSQDIYQLAHALKTDKWSVLRPLKQNPGIFQVQKGQWSLREPAPEPQVSPPEPERKATTKERVLKALEAAGSKGLQLRDLRKQCKAHLKSRDMVRFGLVKVGECWRLKKAG